MNRVRVAVAGVGSFGRNHVRVLREMPGAELIGVVDQDAARARAIAQQFECKAFGGVSDLKGQVDAVVVAVPTSAHVSVACELLSNGIDVLVEKPIAGDRASAHKLLDAAASKGLILQIGHLERFNPAVIALREMVTIPLFFEIHRLSLFSPRSLDVDVVLDLMIHDIDILLSLVREEPNEIRAAGISILSEKVDIANVRLAFPGACIANLTASRVSTERVRKLRLFQPHQYISIDYQRQDGVICTVSAGPEIEFKEMKSEKQEPLRLELEAFVHSVTTRQRPAVSGEDGFRALTVSLDILDKIEVHAKSVAERLS